MSAITADLRAAGFSIFPASAWEAWLGPAWSDWSGFAASWSQLEQDKHMADGGRYRRRRYAVFDIAGDAITRAPHQPHFQAKIYNRLNGGLERWFAPVTPEISQHSITQALLQALRVVFDVCTPVGEVATAWHVELHQFRIEAQVNTVSFPTPEGIHRDGVDGAFVMLVNRNNVASGVTQIFDPFGKSLGSFTLTHPGDAVILDDARVFHAVTPIAPLDAAKAAIRDVLVITFTRKTF